MIGLLLLGFFAVYFLVSFLILKSTVSWAKKRGRSRWVWGALSAVLMYNLVFWDWIPSIVLHEKYCNSEASRTVYISPERWLVQERLDGSELVLTKAERKSSRSNNSSIYPMNSRVSYIIAKEVRWPSILRFEGKYVDIETGKVLAESVDFESGGCSRNDSIMDYRFWMNRCGCKGPMKSSHDEFNNLEIMYQKMGRMTNAN